MSQLVTKFITANAVDDTKARLQNAAYLRARNAANSADVNVIRLNSSNVIEFPSVPQIASGTPSAAADIANVSYVSTQIAALPFKSPCRVAATANTSVSSAAATIDSVSLTSGDRLLLTGQTAGAENGIWVFSAAASPLTRATDAASGTQVFPGMAVEVYAGTVNADTLWEISSDAAITVGTTSITFTKQAPSTTVVPVWNKQTITLISGDITNQYIDLAQSIKASSLDFAVKGGGQQYEGVDYSVSLTGGSGGVTRVSFLNDLATGGNAALVATDVLYVQYQY